MTSAAITTDVASRTDADLVEAADLLLDSLSRIPVQRRPDRIDELVAALSLDYDKDFLVVA
jgi:hypothetical protein